MSDERDAALRESEERYRTLTAELQVGVLIQGPHAEILLSNPKALELLGLTEAQLLGTTSFDPSWNVIHEDGSPFPGPTHPVPQAIATRQPVRDVVMGVFRPAVGDRVWLQVGAVPQLHADGSVRQVVCTFTDITELRRVQAVRSEAEQRYRAVTREQQVILESANVGIALVIAGIHVRVNPALEALFGYDQGELIGKRTRVHYPSDADFDATTRDVHASIATGRPLRVEREFVRKDGAKIWVELNVRPVAPGDASKGTIVVLADRTTHRRAEETLRRSEARFRTMFESHSAVMLLVDPAGGVVVDANAAAARFYGYDRAALRGMSLGQLNVLAPEQVAAAMASAAETRTNTFVFPHRAADGSVRTVEVHSSPVEVDDRRLLFSIIQDISERVRVAAALEANEAQLAFAMEQAQIAYWEWDLATDTYTFNDRFYALYATTAEREGGYRMPAAVYLRELVPPDESPRIAEMATQVARGELPEWTLPHAIVRRDGQRRDIVARGSIVRDAAGRAVTVRGSDQDITERTRAQAALAREHAQLEALNASLAARVAETVAELRAKDRVLIAQSRQAAMGEMLGHIAHQWRQPLNALGLVLANLTDAARFGELDVPVVEHAVAESKRLIQSMSRTINDFRDFFRPEKAKVPFSARAQIHETLAILDAGLRDVNIECAVVAGEDLILFGFPNEYSQVLLNLLSNAQQAILERQVPHGMVTVTLAVREGQGCLTVRDNGGGIPEPLLERIFEPYFSTKTGGTGIGLYMSRQLVEQSMGGRLLVYNVDGGAAFEVITPLASAAAI